MAFIAPTTVRCAKAEPFSIVAPPVADTPSVGETPRALTTQEIARRCDIAIMSEHYSIRIGFLVRHKLLAGARISSLAESI